MAINMIVALGNLTKDPDIFYTSNQTCLAKFTIALNRGKKNGEDLGADFPRVTCFGKTAEIVERYVKKGSQIAIVGHLHTDSYEKDGRKVYTTEIVADRVELLSKTDNKVPSGFEQLKDSDIPF